MPTDPRTFAIVGAGLAGAKAAETLREEGCDGRVSRRWDRVVLRGDPASRELIAFWLAGDRVVAGMNMNVWDVAEPIGALIGHPADARRLADPEVPLTELSTVSQGGAP